MRRFLLLHTQNESDSSQLTFLFCFQTVGACPVISSLPSRINYHHGSPRRRGVVVNNRFCQVQAKSEVDGLEASPRPLQHWLSKSLACSTSPPPLVARLSRRLRSVTGLPITVSEPIPPRRRSQGVVQPGPKPAIAHLLVRTRSDLYVDRKFQEVSPTGSPTRSRYFRPCLRNPCSMKSIECTN